MYRIDPQVRQELEVELGQKVPDPGTWEFSNLLSRLERERPELHKKLMAGLVASVDVVLPSEQFRAKATRRRWARRIIEKLWMKPAWPSGATVDKRRILATVLLVFAVGLLPATYIVLTRSTSTGSSRSRAIEPTAQPAQKQGPSTPQGVSAGKEGVAEAAVVSPRPSSAPASPQSGGDQLPLPPLPGVLPPPPNGEGSPPGGPASVSTGIFAYQAEEAIVSRRPTIFAYEKPAPAQMAEQRIFVYTASSAGERQASASGTEAEPQSTGQATAPAPSGPAPTVWKPGEIVPANLVTGIAIAQGLEPTPVVASSAPPGRCPEASRCEAAIWLGQARYGGLGRVQIEFSHVVVRDRTYQIRAQAFGQDMTGGVPAKVSMRTPTVASQIISAAIGAAGDYFRALATRQQVTITNGWLQIIQGGDPQYWQYLAARIADIFRTGSTGQATVQVAEVAPKTAVNLLILQEGR